MKYIPGRHGFYDAIELDNNYFEEHPNLIRLTTDGGYMNPGDLLVRFAAGAPMKFFRRQDFIRYFGPLENEHKNG
jgi:hypothetical protein